jgi:hypothetical protein
MPAVNCGSCSLSSQLKCSNSIYRPLRRAAPPAPSGARADGRHAAAAVRIRRDNNHANLCKKCDKQCSTEPCEFVSNLALAVLQVKDPWAAVSRGTDCLLATASSRADPRGRFVGVALRPTEQFDVNPTAMQLAVNSDDFAVELVTLLARWGVITA